MANLLLELSPVAHADRVHTPTLILNGEQDQRVPIWQGYEFYIALSRCGCLTHMVLYTHCGHVPADPQLLPDVMERMLDWMEQHFK